MQRRLLQATVWAVAVAVILIGVPVGILSAVQVRQAIESNLETRTQAIARTVERRVAINALVTEDLLEVWVNEADSSALPVSIRVTPPRGSVVEVGPTFDERYVVVNTVNTVSGAEVWVAVSGQAMALRMAQSVLFVAVSSVFAFLAAVGLARYQARRLAAPLIYLAASAEQIAWAGIQLRAIRTDPDWRGGDYHDAARGPHTGLGLARRLAHVTYRSEPELATRFGRSPQGAEHPWRGGRYQVDSYLDHHAEKLVRRFDAASYVVLGGHERPRHRPLPGRPALRPRPGHGPHPGRRRRFRPPLPPRPAA